MSGVGHKYTQSLYNVMESHFISSDFITMNCIRSLTDSVILALGREWLEIFINFPTHITLLLGLNVPYYLFYCFLCKLRRIELSKDQNHGKAWGRMVWRGRVKPGTQRITCELKEQWKLVKTPSYLDFKGTPECVEKEIAKAFVEQEELVALENKKESA